MTTLFFFKFIVVVVVVFKLYRYLIEIYFETIKNFDTKKKEKKRKEKKDDKFIKWLAD